MTRAGCLLLLGHRRQVIGSQVIHIDRETNFGMRKFDVATDILYRCQRCSHVFSRRVRGQWTAEQVRA